MITDYGIAMAAMFLGSFLAGWFFEMVARDYLRRGDRGFGFTLYAASVPMYAMGLLVVWQAVR